MARKTAAQDTSRPHFERLSHLFFVLFRCCQLPAYQLITVTLPDGSGEETIIPRWRAVIQDLGIPPFWEFVTCPPAHSLKWGAHWSRIRDAWSSDKVPVNTLVKNLAMFDWHANTALQMVAQTARIEGWATAWDDLFHDELSSTGRTVRDIYLSEDWADQRDQGPPNSQVWEQWRLSISRSIFGHSISGGFKLPAPIQNYWGFWIGSEIDVARHRWSRSKKALPKIRAKLEALLGEAFLENSADVVTKFRPANCLKVFKLLKEYHDALAWTVLSEDDKERLARPLSDNSPDIIRANLESLVDPLQAHEYCGLSLGWLAGMMEGQANAAQLNLPVLDPHALAAVQRGKALAKSFPDRLRADIAAAHEVDLDAYHEQLFTFADQWMDRETEPLPAMVLDILDGELERGLDTWLGGGLDIGNEAWKNVSYAGLCNFLGLPADGRPFVLRDHVAKDWTLYSPGKDVPIVNSSESPSQLTQQSRPLYHQLQAVAVIITSMRDPKLCPQAHLMKPTGEHRFAPIALQQSWGEVPGTLLADDMGLGKTITTITTIGTIIHLHDGFQEAVSGPVTKRPQCLGVKFGRADRIPDEAHLIVVPLTLVKQWERELKRWTRDTQIGVFVVRSQEKFWAADIALGKNSPHRKSHQIWLTSFSVISRMATKATNIALQDKRVRVNFPLPTGQTLFDRSWLTLFVDEAQACRTGNSLWRGIDAIANLALVKVFASGTPYVEGPKDILFIAQLVRPPCLGPIQVTQIADKLALINRTKNQTRMNRSDAVVFMGTSSTILQSENDLEGNALTVITSGIVKAIQQHLMFHTLRRTGNSRDDTGALISQLLAPLTVVHAILKLTDAEVTEAALFEKAELEEPGKKSLLKLELQRPVTHSAFYSEARKKISLPSDNQIRPLTISTATSPHTKLLLTAELIKLILVHGPENVIPSNLHGSQTAIVTQEELKLPAAHLPTFKPVPLTNEKKNYGTQIIVCTLLALYHEAMVEYFESHGICAVHINGRQRPKERDDIIDKFKLDPTIHVLLMTCIGMTGLNLTNANVMLLHEVNWSSVLAEQGYGRIRRDGQDKPTYAIQMVAEDTVDVLLATVALGKQNMAQQFISLPRQKGQQHFYNNFVELLKSTGNAAEFTLNSDLEDSTDQVDNKNKARQKALRGKKAVASDKADKKPREAKPKLTALVRADAVQPPKALTHKARAALKQPAEANKVSKRPHDEDESDAPVPEAVDKGKGRAPVVPDSPPHTHDLSPTPSAEENVADGLLISRSLLTSLLEPGTASTSKISEEDRVMVEEQQLILDSIQHPVLHPTITQSSTSAAPDPASPHTSMDYEMDIDIVPAHSSIVPFHDDDANFNTDDGAPSPTCSPFHSIAPFQKRMPTPDLDYEPAGSSQYEPADSSGNEQEEQEETPEPISRQSHRRRGRSDLVGEDEEDDERYEKLSKRRFNGRGSGSPPPTFKARDRAWKAQLVDYRSGKPSPGGGLHCRNDSLAFEVWTEQATAGAVQRDLTLGPNFATSQLSAVDDWLHNSNMSLLVLPSNAVDRLAMQYLLMGKLTCRPKQESLVIEVEGSASALNVEHQRDYGISVSLNLING
ncbi:hypothetical protein B0H19DRAFT_1084882 [Mycena capillaripes]|nr:hypothetical protein B0H19DRAFT_1084882 [Mycena capillaripes]